VSVSASGGQGNRASAIEAISPNGRFVLFDSWASNLVRGDTNGVRDVFLRDRLRGRTVRVSVGPGGRQANGPSRGVAVSSDGRFVLFVSPATNLTNQPDRNRSLDVFVRNRLRGTTFRVSVRPGGGQFLDSRSAGLTAGGISDNGRWVAFGEYVGFAGPGCCLTERTYVRDRARQTTTRVARHSPWGVLPVALSPDGRWLSMSLEDESFNVVSYAVRDLRRRRTKSWPGSPYLLSTGFAVTPDAHYIVATTLNAAATGDNLLRWNRITGRVRTIISHRPYGYTPAGISADGSEIAFASDDPTLVTNDTNGEDLFRISPTTKAVVRLDLTSTGAQISRGLARPASGEHGFTAVAALSSDGRWAAFSSSGGRTVPGDTNRVADVFIRGPLSH
jgi:Tol biopolymer transport system component